MLSSAAGLPGLKRWGDPPGDLALGASDDPKRVIIIGAGLAGLVAAYELERAGHRVLVFEARPRPGGRVWTVREGFSPRYPAELGAARILGGHGWTHAYIDHFGLPRVAFDRPSLGDDVHLFRGTRLRRPSRNRGRAVDAQEFGLDVPASPWSDMEARAESLRQTEHAGRRDWPPAEVAELDELSHAQLYARLGVDSRHFELARLGTLVSRDSSASCLTGVAHPSPWYPVSTIFGGMDRLPRAFADRLGEKVRYGCPVRAVRRAGTEARLEVSIDVDASSSESPTSRFSCDAVICTAPLPTLDRIDFEIPLPTGFTAAARTLAYAHSSRSAVSIASRRLRKIGYSGHGRADHPSTVAITPEVFGMRTSTSYCHGAASRMLADVDEHEGRDAARDLARRFHAEYFPELASSLTPSAMAIWSREPWSRGAHLFPERGRCVRWCRGFVMWMGRCGLRGSTSHRGMGGCRGLWNRGIGPHGGCMSELGGSCGLR